MNELLLTLAEEIRQTTLWLGQEEEPSESNIRFRLRTLREAAATARLNAVEAVLADLENRLSDDATSPALSEPVGLEEVLGRLSSLIVSLAMPAEARELEWIGQANQVESHLTCMGDELAGLVERLGTLNLKSDRAIITDDPAVRTDLMLELSRTLRLEIQQLRSWRQDTAATTDLLRHTVSTLMRELSAVHRIPLDPTFARLRERVRRWGRTHARPVSLQARATHLDVGVRQFEALVRVLDFLVDQILETGLDDPEQRRKAGKATVSNVLVEGSRQGSLLELQIEDDGSSQRGQLKMGKPTLADLKTLRARLWRDETCQPGQRLLLQLPFFTNHVEAIPLETGLGEILIPLSVVDQILTDATHLAPELARIDLDRRSLQDASGQESGLVCALGDWRGWLPGRVTGPTLRVVARPATPTDPAWIVGRDSDARLNRPVFHPLPFAGVAPQWKPLFPEESKP